MSKHQAAGEGVTAIVASVDPLLDDVLAIAGETRAYLLAAGGAPSPGAPALAPLYEAAELSRVSARLGYCAAWLLTRRAVQAGELSSEEALAPHWRLEGQTVCGDGAVTLAPLPSRLVELGERSLAVYRRVERLDRNLGT
jgi:regulator of CtrA degradation